MEKYGVLQDDAPAPKTAADKLACKRCGAELRPVSTVGILLCPQCGSKPYEEKE